jgi:hypothetical protein
MVRAGGERVFEPYTFARALACAFVGHRLILSPSSEPE